MKRRFIALALLFAGMAIFAQNINIESEVRMLALGDSYTIGESVQTSQRWPHQLMAALVELGREAEDPDYIATTGWTTTQLIQGIDMYLDRDKKYNLVSILIGVNNQYQGLDISSYEPELKKIINLALDVVHQDASRVFILSIPDYAFTPFGAGKSSISEELDAYNAINKRLASEYDIAYIDITPISRNGLKDPSLVAIDGLHPSADQYKQWIGKILTSLELRETTDP